MPLGQWSYTLIWKHLKTSMLAKIDDQALHHQIQFKWIYKNALIYNVLFTTKKWFKPNFHFPTIRPGSRLHFPRNSLRRWNRGFHRGFRRFRCGVTGKFLAVLHNGDISFFKHFLGPQEWQKQRQQNVGYENTAKKRLIILPRRVRSVIPIHTARKVTLPKTNIGTENKPNPQRRRIAHGLSSNHHFRRQNVSFRGEEKFRIPSANSDPWVGTSKQ